MMHHFTRTAGLCLLAFAFVASVHAQNVPDLPGAPGSNPINMTAPLGGSTVIVGQSVTISWTMSSSVSGTVELDLLDASGTVLTSIADGETDDGSYTWDTSGLSGSAGSRKVRVSATNDADVRDESDATFELVNPSVSITSPNGGETVLFSQELSISWTSLNLGGDTVEIDLLDSGGSLIMSIADSETDDGAYTWLPPSTVSKGSYKIRVMSTTYAAATDVSDATFDFKSFVPRLPTDPSPDWLQVAGPNGGESIEIGTSSTITWSTSSTVTGTVEIDLLNSEGALVSAIANAETNDGTYSWDTSGLTGGSYLLQVSATSNGAVLDQSDSTFEMTSPSILVTAPNGGERIRVGTSSTITWTSTNVTGTVELDLLNSSDVLVRSIADAETNDGSYTWDTSGIADGKYKVQVSSTSDGDVKDASDATFRLRFSAGAFAEGVVEGTFDGAKGVAAGDIDGDGDVDVVGAASGSNDISWWSNTAGNASAWTATLIEGEFTTATSVTIADIDRDGHLDVLAASSGLGDVTWWRNTSGDGSAWSATIIDGSFGTTGVVVAADIDRDGDMDVVGASSSLNDVVWWENNGTPTTADWTETIIDASFGGAYGVAVEDVDGDGDLDVVGTNESGGAVSWWTNNGTPGTANWTEVSIGTSFAGAYGISTGDVDGDGDPDVIAAANSGDEIAWWSNTAGNGSAWSKQSVDASFDGARSAVASDFDGDGDLDILGAASDAGDISWWENANGTGTSWTEHSVVTDLGGAWEAVHADLDGDGDADFLGAGDTADEISWWKNATMGRATGVGSETTVTSSNNVRTIDVADVDGDGDQDILAASYNGDFVAWYANTAGDGSAWTETKIDAAFDGGRWVHAADVDGDGDLDVVGAANVSGDVSWWENNGSPGTANWTETLIDGSVSGVYQVTTADIDQDGDLDVVGSSPTLDDVLWWENDGTPGGADWNETTIDGSYDGAQGIVIADIDGDGDPDVAGAALSADDVAWWANNGSGGGWSKTSIDSNINGANRMHAADMDGDGDMDVLASAEAADEVTWYENTAGNGSAWTKRLVDSFDKALDVRAADFDGDGDMDVLAAAGFDDEVAWWENTNGAGTSWTKHSVDASVDDAFTVSTGDIDGDGDLDFVGGSRTPSYISWWANDTHVRSSSVMLSGTAGTGNNVGWRLLSAPCAAQTRANMLGVFVTGSDEVVRYDQSLGSGDARWIPTALGDNLPQGTGFGTYLYDDATQEVSGEFGITFPDCTPTLVDVTVNTLDADEEWFLAGNPFMNSFDLSNLGLTDFQATIKMWNPSTGTYVDVTQSGGSTDVIPVGQGFFIQRTTVGQGATSITFDYAGVTSGGSFVGKRNDGETGQLGMTLKVQDEAGQQLAYDEAATILINDDAKIGWDRYASSKFRPLQDAYATLALIADRAGTQEALSRFSLPTQLNEIVSIPLQIDAVGVSGAATIAWPKWTAIPDDWDLMLQDVETGINVNLRMETTYTFAISSEAGSDGSAGKNSMPVAIQLGAQSDPRFTLVISPAGATAIETNEVPSEWALDPAYPNPFNPVTTLRFAVPETSSVSLMVYDVLGRRVAKLVDGTVAAGRHEARFDGTSLGSGVYLYVLTTPNGVLTRTVTLVK